MLIFYDAESFKTIDNDRKKLQVQLQSFDKKNISGVDDLSKVCMYALLQRLHFKLADYTSVQTAGHYQAAHGQVPQHPVRVREVEYVSA